MSNPTNARLAARAHQLQISLVDKTDLIASKVGRLYARLVNRLMAIASMDVHVRHAAVHSAVAQAEADAYHTLETEYRKLIVGQYGAARRLILSTVPPAWFARMQQAMPEDEARDWQRFADMVMPSLDRQQVDSILTSPGYNKLTWEERFRHYAKADQDQIEQELTNGISAGEGIRALRQRMETIVDGPRYKAERIARTEARRVAEQGSYAAYVALGDMLDGMQVMAVMDQATRPEHAARNGKIYRRRSGGPEDQFYDDRGQPLPELPDAPNCRCTAIPVLKMPETVAEKPKEKAHFRRLEDQNAPDPAAYADWFASASEKQRHEAVGVRRYQIVADRLRGSEQPEWADFIDTEGSLLSPKQLKAESRDDRRRRKTEVTAMLAERERLYREVAGKGFLWPDDPPTRPRQAKKPPQPKPSNDVPKPVEKAVTRTASYRPAKTIREAEQIAKALNLAEHVSYKGIALEHANEINKSLHRHLRSFKELRKDLKFIGTIQEQRRLIVRKKADEVMRAHGLSDSGTRKAIEKQIARVYGRTKTNVWAHSTGPQHSGGDVASGIAFNEKYFSRKARETLQAGLNRAMESGFHPIGCNTVQSIVDHELGHQIDNLLGLTTRSTVRDQDLLALIQDAGLTTKAKVTQSISQYASTNYQELVAEAWAEYNNNPHPREAATRIGQLIDQKRKARP